MKRICHVLAIQLCAGLLVAGAVHAEDKNPKAKSAGQKHLGVGATPVKDADVLMDGSRKYNGTNWALSADG